MRTAPVAMLLELPLGQELRAKLADHMEERSLSFASVIGEALRHYFECKEGSIEH